MRRGVLCMFLLVAGCGGSAPVSNRPAPPAASAVSMTSVVTADVQPSSALASSYAANVECDLLEPTSVASLEADRNACFARDADACTRVAAAYACGRTIARDVRRAFEYAGAACRLESAPGCRIAASVASAPDGSRLDATRAYGYALRGCILEDHEACNQMARALATGRGVPADPAEAAQIFDGLCNHQGVAAACASLSEVAARGAADEADPASDAPDPAP
jgi:uncharacterized protein